MDRSFIFRVHLISFLTGADFVAELALLPDDKRVNTFSSEMITFIITLYKNRFRFKIIYLLHTYFIREFMTYLLEKMLVIKCSLIFHPRQLFHFVVFRVMRA